MKLQGIDLQKISVISMGEMVERTEIYWSRFWGGCKIFRVNIGWIYSELTLIEKSYFGNTPTNQNVTPHNDRYSLKKFASELLWQWRHYWWRHNRFCHYEHFHSASLITSFWIEDIGQSSVVGILAIDTWRFSDLHEWNFVPLAHRDHHSIALYWNSKKRIPTENLSRTQWGNWS